MREQFFGKLFWTTLAGTLASLILGFIVLGNPASAVLTVLCAVAALALSLYRLEYGLYLAFAELFTFSHGHLFSITINGFEVSARIAIFVGVMLAWLIRHIRGPFPSLPRPWRLLLAAIVIGLVTGAINNPLLDVFKDGNAYGYLLYLLPVLSISWTALQKNQLLQVLTGSAAAVTTTTLSILYLFTHLPEPVMRAVYTFVRDTRLAELTRIAGDIFRIFLQAQFSVLILLFLFSAAVVVFWKKRQEQAVIFFGLAFAVSVMIISLSRSFWIGLIAGGIVFVLASFSQRVWTFKEAITFAPVKLLLLLTSLSILWITIAFPFPTPANVSVFGSILKERTTDVDDSAISSRWNLLPEMWTVIKQSPILGSGFGTKVAFESDDPRVRAVYPDGKWRTYSFEWGWLDAWLKMGVFGPIALFWVGFTLARGLFFNLKRENGWISLGLLCSLAALFATHVFSPYLNHPIGLGFLIFLVPFLSNDVPKMHAVHMHLPDVLPANIQTAYETSQVFRKTH